AITAAKPRPSPSQPTARPLVPVIPPWLPVPRTLRWRYWPTKASRHPPWWRAPTVIPPLARPGPFPDRRALPPPGSGFNNPPAPSGNQVAFLQMSGSSISQTVNLAAGIYMLGFGAAQRPGNHQTFQVQVDGAVVASITPTGSQFAPYVAGPFAVATA